MNKGELIERIAKDAEITKTQANDALDAFTKAVTDSLKKGGKVTLVGFGIEPGVDFPAVLQVNGLGEFCCASRPLRTEPSTQGGHGTWR